MPVWSVAPSGMKRAACSAIARSASVGGGSGRPSGAASLSTSTSISSTCRACRCSGGRPARVRVPLGGLHDEQAVRIAPRAVQLVNRAARVEREAAVAVAVRRRRDRRHHPRRLLREERLEPAEVRGREADVRARVAQHPLERAEEPGQVVHIRVVEEVAAHGQQRPVDPQVLPVVAPPSAWRNSGGWPGPSGIPSVSVGSSRAAASSAVTSASVFPRGLCAVSHVHGRIRPRRRVAVL